MKKFRTKLLLKELFRKSIHLCSAFIPFLLKYQKGLTIVLLILAACAYSLCEYFRSKGKNIPLISNITRIAARKRDEDKFVLGPVTLVFGILTAALILPYESAKIGIYALAFGDGLASLCGKFLGRIHIPFTKGKTVAGSLACWTAVFLASFISTKQAFTSLILATAAMLLEVLPLQDFDNLLIPISIGGLYFLISGL